MVDLSNFELCILLDLYYRRNKLISVDSAPEKSTELYCEILNNLYQKIIKDENKFLELDKDKKRLKGIYRRIEGAYNLQLKTRNIDELENFLREYAEYCSNDELHPYEEYTFLAKIREFVKSINAKHNLTHYYINNSEIIPILLYGLTKNEIILKELKYELFPPKEMIPHTSAIKLKHQNYKGNHENDFGFEAVVDISKFYNNYNPRTQTDAKNPDELSLTEPQWRIYHVLSCVVDSIKQFEPYSIEKDIFFRSKAFKSKNTFNKERSIFNTRVRQILKRTKNSKLRLIDLNKQNKNEFNIDMVLYRELSNKIELTPPLKKEYEDFKKSLL